MGLKGDLDEVARLWSAAPWRVRLYLALSALLASTSIASLSETVFKWKGFVLDALSFYRNYLSTPLASAVAQIFRFHPPAGYGDYLVVQLLVIATLVRVAAFMPIARRARIMLVAVLLVMLPVSWLLWASLPPAEHPVSPAAIYVFNLWLLWSFLKGAARFLAVVWLLAPAALVAVVAAVHSGLSR